MKKIDHGQELRGIGKRIRQVRNLVGLSQGRMAQLVGISNQSTYGNYESGRSVPVGFVMHFHEVCKSQLGVRFSLDWLLNGEGQGPAIKHEPSMGAKPAAMTSLATPRTESDRTESSPTRSNNIDQRISEQVAMSVEVLKELLQKKCAAQQSPEESVHSYLREVPFAVVDMMSIIRYISPAACRLFKTTASAAVGHSTMRFGREALEEVVPEQITAMLEQGYWIGEVRAHTSQFEPLELVMIQWLIRDKDGTPCMAFLVVPKNEIEDTRKELAGLQVESVKSHVAWERDRTAG